MAGIVKGNRLNKVQVYLLLPAMLLMLKISSLSVARTVAVIILVDVATVRENCLSKVAVAPNTVLVFKFSYLSDPHRHHNQPLPPANNTYPIAAKLRKTYLKIKSDG